MIAETMIDDVESEKERTVAFIIVQVQKTFEEKKKSLEVLKRTWARVKTREYRCLTCITLSVEKTTFRCHFWWLKYYSLLGQSREPGRRLTDHISRLKVVVLFSFIDNKHALDETQIWRMSCALEVCFVWRRDKSVFLPENGLADLSVSFLPKERARANSCFGSVMNTRIIGLGAWRSPGVELIVNFYK